MKPLYYEDCVRHALQLRGIKENDFENTQMRVYQRKVANPRTVFRTLAKGGIVIPTVEATLFGSEDTTGMAIILLSTNDNHTEVTLYNPMAHRSEQLPVDRFFTAWQAAGGQCTTAFDNDGTYMPKLLDLTYVEIPDDMDDLLEAMAENAHDMWALERQSEGWTYGPERNDQLLTTPDMVPYADLAESEKQYDRIMATDTLKLLIALGYNIVRK